MKPRRPPPPTTSLDRAFNAPSLLEQLNRLLAQLWRDNPFYQQRWRRAGLEPQPLPDLPSFRRYPLLRRQDMLEDQSAHPPLGNNLSQPIELYTRLHHSSGNSGAPIFWGDTPQSWDQVLEASATLFRLAEVQPGQLAALCLPFGASAGPWIIHEGAGRLGCRCLALGHASQEIQVRHIARFRPEVLVGKPSHLLGLAREAQALGLKPSALGVEKLILTGENGFSALREELQDQFEAACFDRYGLTEAGSVAGECGWHPDGLHLLDEHFLAETIDPHTAEPVAPGAKGELVLTSLNRRDRPIVRYRTGDCAHLQQRHRCGCGRVGSFLLGGVQRLAPLTAAPA